MATRGKKKPTKRKTQGASRLNGSLSVFGWLASAAVAGAWAVSDGRPTRFAAETLGHVRSKLGGENAADRVAELIEGADTDAGRVRPASFRPAPVPPRERPAAVESAHPTPKPAPVVAKVDLHVPTPVAAPLLPLAAPPLAFAIRRPQPAAVASQIGAPVGEERHATRALAAHAAPDAASATLASVDSGSAVFVLRSAGDWRYVRGSRSGVEGWVDGRFLAGEAMAADLATLANEDLARGR